VASNRRGVKAFRHQRPLENANGLDRVLMARQIAMSQRVNAALDRLSTKSDRWSGRLFWATWAILAATAVLVVLTLVLVLKA
jgi:hypothetical protein